MITAAASAAMDTSSWIGLGSLAFLILSNACLCAYFFGDIRAGVKSLVAQGQRQDDRLDTHEVRLNDHTGRIARIEGRLDIGE